MADNSIDFRIRLIDEFSQVATRARGSLRQLKEGAEEFGTGFKEGAAQARSAADEADRAGGSMRKLSGDAEAAGRGGASMAGAFKVAAGALATLGLAKVGKDLIGLGVSTAATKEQMRVSFTTLMKDSGRAKDELKWLTDAAAATPFELSDLTAADKTLLGFGITSDKVRRDFLMGMGDMASAVGVTGAQFPEFAKVFGQIHAAGKLQTQDMLQLVNYGVGFETVAKSMGMSVADLRSGMEKGAITAEMFEAGMSKAFRTDYAGGMEAQSKTFNGKLSTFKDSVANTLSSMFEPYLPALGEAIEGGGKVFEEWVGKIPAMVEKLKPGFEVVTGALGWVKDNSDTITAGLVALTAAFATLQVVNGISTGMSLLTGAMNLYRAGTLMATIQQWALNTALLSNPIGLVVAAIAGLVAGLVWFFTKTETGQKVWEAFTLALSIGWTIAVGKISAGKDKIVEGWNWLTTKAGELKDSIGQKVDAIVGFFTGLPGRIMDGLSGLKDRIAGAFPDWLKGANPLGISLPGLGDTATSMAAGGNLTNTLAGYRALGGGLGISNVWVGGGGRGYGSGDHQAGRALDLVGSGAQMSSFVARARGVGDFAELHGSGAGRHVHYVPRNDYAGGSSSYSLVPGGMGDTTASMAGGVYVAPGAVVVSGVSDPRAAAEMALSMLQRKIANARERR